jgi:hypothetical protein
MTLTQQRPQISLLGGGHPDRWKAFSASNVSNSLSSNDHSLVYVFLFFGFSPDDRRGIRSPAFHTTPKEKKAVANEERIFNFHLGLLRSELRTLDTAEFLSIASQ